MKVAVTITGISGIANLKSQTLRLGMPPGYMLVKVGDAVSNETTGVSGTVTDVSEPYVTTDVLFNPGDFFYIQFTEARYAQTVDGVVTDIECKRCGFSFPRQKLQDGLCPACWDS